MLATREQRAATIRQASYPEPAAAPRKQVYRVAALRCDPPLHALCEENLPQRLRWDSRQRVRWEDRQRLR